MRKLPIAEAEMHSKDAQLPSYLAVEEQESRWLRWWYRLASPPVPPASATFKERELFRRGRTGSQILPALYVLLIVALPAGFLGTNFYLVPIVISCFCLLALATLLNRLGFVNPAGFIVVITFMAFPIANIVTTPGGLNMMVLPVFGLLILPLVCAVSFLPPWWVFVVALTNCLFTFFSLTQLPQTAELSGMLAINFTGIVTPIILSQMIISVVAYLWVSSTVQALARADRAEEIARLEHDLAVQAEAAARQKEQLEASIQKIVETHTRVANGDYAARVPLTGDNVLWQISGSLNNLLARMQRLHQDAAELQQMKLAFYQLREENRRLMEQAFALQQSREENSRPLGPANNAPQIYPQEPGRWLRRPGEERF
jgi:HAMP domain-containing protein